VDMLEREGIPLRHLDIGGGLGIRYRDEQPPAVAEYLHAMLARLGPRPHRILLEPGRALVGNAGLLVTRVEYLKPGAHGSFAVVDAAMNDLMRPALYDAWHDILPVVHRSNSAVTYDGRSRDLAITEGDLLAVMSAGAYGMSMSSNYNTRPRAAEVMVDGSAVHLIRARESLESLYAGERVLPR
jgi:diaminopimelate decarboxylase